MKPMGSDAERLMGDELARQIDRKQQAEIRGQPGASDEDLTEIAYPEDRYGVACIGCGIESHLQMIPHRCGEGLLVGWIFCCETCRPDIIGRRVWFGDVVE